MKLAFISDIHGNATALDAVLDDIKNKHIDKIIVLGDLCYRGLEPQRSLDLIRALDTYVIKGNADEWVVRGVKKGEVPEAARSTMNEERAWTVSQLKAEGLEYLKNLQEELYLEFGEVSVHVFHATPNSLFDVMQPDESDGTIRERLFKKDANIYVYAHIHKPFIRYINGKCLINTGSVGLPFDGFNEASYVIINVDGDNFEPSIIRVDYDVKKVIDRFKESNYPNKKLLIKVLKESSV